MTSGEIAWIVPTALVLWALPLLSFVISLSIRPAFAWVVPVLSSFLLLLATVGSFLVFNSVWMHEPVSITWNWFSINEVKNIGQLKLDNLSVLMMLIVNFISLLVHTYSAGYMAGDAGLKRYFAVLGLFTFSMIGIVLSDHFLITFSFWELVGFSSYLLIGHWREKETAGAAATKAFLFNRVGDAGFLIGIGIIWAHTGSLHFTEVSQATFTAPWMTWAGIFIFCGVIGKSAQFPLLTWLPDAMEGPTPVSALIHAATMVAAGIFFVARVYFLFTPTALIVIGITGAITALWGAWGALREFDIKKILAYSTVSQLGFMIIGMSSGHFTGSILHLFTHAFSKACLFLGAGIIIHYLHRVQHHTPHEFDAQDIRNMGGLRKYLPNTCIAFLMAGSSLAGIPFFSGYLSKEAILTQLFTAAIVNQSFMAWTFLGTAIVLSFLTVLYTFRLIWFVFFGACRISAHIEEAKNETVPRIMLLPVFFLALASVWIMVSWNPFDPAAGWLYPGFTQNTQHYAVFSLLSTGWIIFSVILSYLVLKTKKEPWTPITFFIDLDRILKLVVKKPLEQIAHYTSVIDKRWIDRGIHLIAYTQVAVAHLTAWCDRLLIDGTVNGLAQLTAGSGSWARSVSGGKIQSYILWAMAVLIIFILWILLY